MKPILGISVRHQASRFLLSTLGIVSFACMSCGPMSEGPPAGNKAAATPGSQTASEAGRFDGRISGTVLSAETGAPVAGAYVGVGDFGDAGGTNLARFHEQGLYAYTETDAEGRFVLENVAFRERHPLIVTHPDFVRQAEGVALRKDKPDVEVRIHLKSAGRIPTTVVDEDNASVAEPFLIRLEALDGRRFIPPGRQRHLSAFASSVWQERVEEGWFTFSELDSGDYLLEAFRVADSSAVYYGACSIFGLEGGQTRKAVIRPEHYDTRLKITVPNESHRASISPSLVVLSRNLGLLLWDMDRAYRSEDARLGRIVQNALLWRPVPPNQTFTFENLPPGAYSVFAGPFYNLSGERVEVDEGRDTTVDLPWSEPAVMGAVRTYRLNRRVHLEQGTSETKALCAILSRETESNPEIVADPSIESVQLNLDAFDGPIWDVLENLYLQKGWRIEEQGDATLVLLPKNSAD